MGIDLSGIDLDPEQKQLLEKLKLIARHLNSGSLKKVISKIINGSNVRSGIYIYGSVGCGKSTIAKAFFDSVKCGKKFLHYQGFIRKIHKSLSISSTNNVIDNLVKEYSKIKLLCIDEFEIKDITDAMIVSRLLLLLKKRGVFILITTNTAPNDLYKGGLQRSSFLPFIDMVLNYFEIFSFSNIIDYRMSYISSKRRVIYPLDKMGQSAMKDAISHLIAGHEPTTTIITVFGRDLTFSRTYKSVLITDFRELCEANLSYNDYIEICNNFSCIVMENVPIISAAETDVAIRFIHFIDSVYFTRKLLLISLEAHPKEIYKNGKVAEEFKRTISRLYEIGSENYNPL